MSRSSPTAYFIGGAPRTGKSTLSRRFVRLKPMQSASTDAIRNQLRRTVLESTEPALYYLDSLNADETNMARLMREQTSDIIAAADRESEVVWATIESYVRTNLKAGHNIVVEGVAVLPSFIAKLDIPYSAVFLGNHSVGHTNIIQTYANTHPNSWLGKLQPATIEAFGIFASETSLKIKSDAAKFSFGYVDMGEGSFEHQLETALSLLMRSPSSKNA